MVNTQAALRIVATGRLNPMELIELGKIANNRFVWQAVLPGLNLASLTADELIELSLQLQAICPEIQLAVVQTGKLNADQLWSVGLYANSPTVWLAVIKTGTLTNDQLLKVGNMTNTDEVWNAIADAFEYFQT